MPPLAPERVMAAMQLEGKSLTCPAGRHAAMILDVYSLSGLFIALSSSSPALGVERITCAPGRAEKGGAGRGEPRRKQESV